MGKKLGYYEALGLSHDADDVEIKKAFRKLALKYHPDINSAPSAVEEFAIICEAYDVLSNAHNKGFYDLYGEDGLKEGVPDGRGGILGGAYSFDASAQPLAVFAKFFGTSNPFEALTAIAAQYQATTDDKPMQGKHKMYKVELSLEEIYHGCVKKVTHVRKTLHDSGEVTEEERPLVVDCKPGLQDGTKFVFDGEGNRTPKRQPGPVVFTLVSKPHPVFSRRGYDLVHKVTIPLYQGLIGTPIDVPMLDGRLLSVPLTKIVTPGFKHVVEGEGMPKPDGSKGSLVLEVDLLFPDTVTETQKMLLKAAFFLPHRPSLVQQKAIKGFEDAFKNELLGWRSGFPKQEEAAAEGGASK